MIIICDFEESHTVTTYQSLILPINWRNALTKFHMDLIVQHFIFYVTSSFYVTYSLKKLHRGNVEQGVVKSFTKERYIYHVVL